MPRKNAVTPVIKVNVRSASTELAKALAYLQYVRVRASAIRLQLDMWPLFRDDTVEEDTQMLPSPWIGPVVSPQFEITYMRGPEVPMNLWSAVEHFLQIRQSGIRAIDYDWLKDNGIKDVGEIKYIDPYELRVRVITDNDESHDFRLDDRPFKERSAS